MQGSNVWLTVGLREGKNREVKRVLAHLGLDDQPPDPHLLRPVPARRPAAGEVREIRGRVLRDQLGAKLAEAAGADFDAPIRPAPAEPPTPKPRGGKAAARQARRGRNAVRIVGGEFRGRPLAAPARPAPSGRPPTALRQTIFDILAHAYGDPVTGARVLDLFAGTGALGLEALSRGAAYALFVEEGVEARGASSAATSRRSG